MTDSAKSRFTDEQLKAVLARAIDLDAKGLTTTTELRAIASELGISNEAVEMALREHAKVSTARISEAGRRASFVAALGVPLGAIAGPLLSTGEPLPILGALGVGAAGLVASGTLVVFQGKTATLRSFHVRNFVLWAGAAAGGIVALTVLGSTGTLPAATIMFGWSLRSWLASSILGSTAVIAVRRVARPDGSNGSIAPSTTPDDGGRIRLATRRLVQWLSDTLRRETSRLRSIQREHATARPAHAAARNVSA